LDKVDSGWVEDLALSSRAVLSPLVLVLCLSDARRAHGRAVRAYVETLKTEIATMARLIPEGVKVARLHWGGGTPTLLPAPLMAGLADTLSKSFDYADDIEFSVEVDPNEIDESRLDVLADAGMNRASIGVQDFDPGIQQTIGRIQSYEVTRDAVEALRARGIHSLNADILFGLPDQSQARISDSVQMLLSLSPDRVALYGYAHVPWMAKRQAMIPTEALPSPEQRLKLFDTARRLFLWDKYQEIGIDHFAKDTDSMAEAARTGHLRRNFQGYTDDTCDVLIGLGASAISRFPQGYAQNDSSTAAYQKAVRAGQLATGRGHVFKGEDVLRSRMIEMLMCDFAISTAQIATEFGLKSEQIEALYAPAVAQFGDMVRVDSSGFAVTHEGRPLARMIARAFDEYEMRAEGHSSAI
jgi:oxygen-independent coproporphyrinogen-3 oxidase